MLNKMRSMARPIIWAIAIIFVGGMALMGIGKIFSPKNYVGVIAGEKIKYQKYHEMLKNSYDNFVQNAESSEINPETYRELNDQTWNQLVQSIIFDNAIKKFNLKISPKKIADKILNEPPEMLKQNPNLQTDGKFDNAKYYQALQNPQTGLKLWLESYFSQLALYEKLMEFVSSSVIVSDAEIEKDYTDKNTKATADIIVFSTDLTDSVNVTEIEEKEYYNEHKDDYKKDPQRKLKYIKIPLKPGPADIKTAENLIDEIYKMVLDGDNFAELAKDYSDCPSADKGGDLGFFGHGKMDKAFEEAAFSMEIGEISEPVKSSFGWHIIKITDIRSEEEKKEVKASHILVEEKVGAETRNNLEKIAFDFYEQCQEDSFEVVAKNFNYEIKETSEFSEKSQYLPGIGKNKTLIDFAFSNKKYEVSKPYQITSGDYFIAMISYKIGEHFDPFENVKDVIKSKIELEKKMGFLANIADSISANISSEKFSEIAGKNDLEIVNAKLTKKSNYIRGVGRENDLIKIILSLKKVGKISDLYKGEKGYYLAKLLEFQEPDMEKFEEEKESLKANMLKRKEDAAYNSWFTKEKEKANIKDWRNKYYKM
ncbi:MAG: peptidylprolyl isomerase [Candidatus Cloacimonetes bacterium]|nr:peptidylprolyl isomerase [Candidatus Cloacimonadota bacterium]